LITLKTELNDPTAKGWTRKSARRMRDHFLEPFEIGARGSDPGSARSACSPINDSARSPMQEPILVSFSQLLSIPSSGG